MIHTNQPVFRAILVFLFFYVPFNVFALDFAFAIGYVKTTATLTLDSFTVELHAVAGSPDDDFIVRRRDQKRSILFHLYFDNGTLTKGESFYPNGNRRAWFGSSIYAIKPVTATDPLFTLQYYYVKFGRFEFTSDNKRLAYRYGFDKEGKTYDTICVDGRCVPNPESFLEQKDTSFRFLLMEDADYELISAQIQTHRTLEPLKRYSFDPNAFVRSRLIVDIDSAKTHPDYKQFVKVVKRFFKKEKTIEMTAHIDAGKLKELVINTAMEDDEKKYLVDVITRGCTESQIRIFDIPFSGIIEARIEDPSQGGC